MDEPAQQRKRDPEARRKAIVSAAAEILIESGDLTHRVVAQRAGVPLGATTYYFSTLHDLRTAALVQLSDEVTVELGKLAEEVRAAHGAPDILAALLTDYLEDQDQLRTDAALYSTALRHSDLREIAVRWTEGFIEMAEQWTNPATARCIAVFIDGATIHASLTGSPLDSKTLEHALTALLRQEDPRL